MTASSIRKQVDEYLPLLTASQQTLILELMKSMLNLDSNDERITLQQYNNELNQAVARVNDGEYLDHSEVVKQLKR